MTTEANNLVLIRAMDVSRDKIWRCWTEAELLMQWFCPKPWFVSDVCVDLRPGGALTTVMNGPEGERFETTGVFLEIIPNERIVTTDAFLPDWTPSARAFMVTEVLLEDMDDGKTRYTATARHWNAEARAEHEAMGFHEGWGKAAEQLEALAKSV